MRGLGRWAAGVVAGGLLLGAGSAGAQPPPGQHPQKPAPASPKPGDQPAQAPAPSNGPGQPGQAQSPARKGKPAGPGQALTGELPLSLQDAIAMTIENSLDVQIARFDPLIADQDLTSAWGYYDPRASATYLRSHTEVPIASTLQSGNVLLEEEDSGTTGLSGEIPKLGWQFNLGYSASSLSSTSSIQDLSPEYSQGVIGSVTLPLLKNFLWNQPWLLVKTTSIVASSSLDQFRATLMDTVVSVEGAYWELVAAKERLRVANKSLESNLTLLDQTKAQYDVGVVSKVEVVQSEAGVAEAELNRITQENLYKRAQDQLIDRVLGPNLTPDSTLEVVPTSNPDVVKYDVDAETATAKAFENSPELALAHAEVERQDVNRKFARNQLLPQLDAVGSYGYNGIAGVTNPAPGVFGTPRQPVAGVGRNFGDANDGFFTGSGARSWTAGGVFSIPLGSVTSRAEFERADLELRRARTQVRRVEQSLVLQVRDAIRNMLSAQEGIEAAERRRVAAEEQYRAERIRLEHGESTPFDVLQRERDLVDAESQKIAALQIYRNSLAALDRAQGTILRDRGVVVEDARTLR